MIKIGVFIPIGSRGWLRSTTGLKGIMLMFDDFTIGIEQLREHIQPLMKTRSRVQAAA